MQNSWSLLMFARVLPNGPERAAEDKKKKKKGLEAAAEMSQNV